MPIRRSRFHRECRWNSLTSQNNNTDLISLSLPYVLYSSLIYYLCIICKFGCFERVNIIIISAKININQILNYNMIKLSIYILFQYGGSLFLKMIKE